MGTLYYAINVERKEAYALNKGDWHLLTDVPNDQLVETIRECHAYRSDHSAGWADEYKRWASELEAYMPFVIVSDDDTEYEQETEAYIGPCTITGSRFKDDCEIGEILYFNGERS